MTLRASRISIYRKTGVTNCYDRSSKADSLAHVELDFTEMVDRRVIFKQDGRYKWRVHDNARFYIAPDLYVSGIKAIATGEPLRKYQSKARCNWRVAAGMDIDGDLDDPGYEFDEAGGGMLGGDV